MIIESGHVAVVTGAARGLGRALAAQLVDKAVSVVLADIDADALRTTAEELASGGGKVLAVPTDVREQSALDVLAERTTDHFGRIDLVVNNAGIAGGSQPIWATGAREWREVVDVNLFGVVHGIRAFVPKLIEAGRGHVVNIASLAGIAVPSFGSAYGASKHAIVAISESLREELDTVATAEIGVTVACPGVMRTPMAAALFDERTVEDVDLPPHLTAEQAKEMRAAAMANAVEPEQAARRILDAVEQNHLHTLPNGDFMSMARTRTEAIMSVIPAR
ncbi:SDR family NAD(P)-dependent oxidoreductase [Saccharopolyspora erythraea]|uniref:SDR family oxidoreductase n=1 Tax=Saccharopolyspora erythraea TaxID=1836 RepID=UPI001BABB6CC|nr:SDR family NAD(P)-dependent oxidoreductase [Saccharopolyspora erythraea]QUH00442.1 SDR family NAD(P)-dependent oxidoreductase [Saccharopolyspora erythraea]